MGSDLQAVLWDLDGTLIASEPLWVMTEQAVAARHGFEWTQEDGLAVVGLPVPDTARRLLERGAGGTIDEMVAELFDMMQALITESGLPYRPGVEQLMADLREAGVAQAIVTQSFGGYVDAVVDALPDGLLAMVMTGNRVRRGKPDPEIYLGACDELGLRPSDALAIEDSPAGVGAILAAGVTPVAVPFLVDVPAAAELLLLETLEGVASTDLISLHREWQGARAVAQPAVR